MNTMTNRPEPETELAGLHCYAACRRDISVPEGPGVAGAAIELLADGPIAVLASPLPLGVEPGDRESLEAHARVVQQAFATGVVLPLRFPTIAPSRTDTVEQFLRPRRRFILRALERLDGREEIRVRVTYDEEASVAEVLTAIPRLARLRGRSDAALQLGEGIVSELRDRARRDVDAVVETLRPLTVDLMIDSLGGERDVLVASALAPSGSTERIAEAVGRWAASRPPVRVRVKGPLPPYSFADLE